MKIVFDLAKPMEAEAHAAAMAAEVRPAMDVRVAPDHEHADGMPTEVAAPARQRTTKR